MIYKSMSQDFLGYLRAMSHDVPLTQKLADQFRVNLNNQASMAAERKWISAKAGEVEFKANMDRREIEGYASVFDVKDQVDDTVRAGAYKKSLKELKDRGLTHKALWQHDWMSPVGHSRVIKEDKVGLYFKDAISKIPMGDMVLELVDDGTIEGISVGISVEKQTLEEDNSARFGFTRDIHQAKLYEHSYVTFPALLEARVTSVHKHGLANLMPNINSELDLFGFLQELAKKANGKFTAHEVKSIQETISILTKAIQPIDKSKADESETKKIEVSAQPVSKSLIDLVNYITQ